MKSIFFGMLAFFSATAFAQDLNFQQYRKFLMNGTQGAGPKMAIQTSCTTAAGQTYRIGEKGYDLCLAAIKKQSTDTTSTQGKTEGSTTLHIGK